MPRELIGILGLVVFIGLMFVRIPLAFAFALVGGIGMIILVNFQAGTGMFASVPFSWATTYTFTTIPMFVLMGLLIAETGVAKDLYSAAHVWLGRLPGGLAMATLLAVALFSALSGTAVAAAAAIGTICYPEMKAFRYDPRLSSGVIAAGSTMDIMIPPSIPMIIFALAADVSVGKMFIAGFVPGALEVLLFCLIIYVMVKRNPALAPKSAETPSFVEKVKGSKGVLPIIAIFLLVFGGLYGGVFSPTEAGAAGVVSSILVVLLMRRLTLERLRRALGETLRITGTIFSIIIGVMLFNQFIALSGLSTKLGQWVISVGASPVSFLLIVLALYLVLGAMMEEISMMLLTIPLYMPAVQALDIDPVHFGILVILAWQIGLIAPPVGLIAFVTQDTLKEVPIQTVYKGCLPFIAALVVIELLVLFVPDTALFLAKVVK